MRPGDLAPDHANLGSADLLLSLVDIRDLLAEVEAIVNASASEHISLRSFVHVLSRVGVVDALDLDQTRLGVGGVSVPLVAEVTTPTENAR